MPLSLYYLFLYLFIYLFIKQLRQLIAVHVYSGKSVDLEARELCVAQGPSHSIRGPYHSVIVPHNLIK